VINALSEVGIQPDLVAGSSVGAITAAMAARAFDDEAGRDQRAQAIRRLAATYLAIDRLILTDRFSDFIRTFTVRGAQTRFSLFSADRTFRRYDADRTGRFDQKVRQVAAGLERLLWVSPFELLALVKAFRLDDSQSYEKLLRDYFQEVLDRSGVGREILGTEPLQLLIREHVLRGLGGDPSRTAKEARFDAFLKRSGALFLATATNLDEGRLEILGDRQLGDKGAVSLLQGLLASSAFPSVFRPRRAWEVMPDATTDHLLADGGLMDNLPLDAVAQQLLLAADAGLVAKRPATPHLLFSASLEPEVGELDRGQATSIGESWIRIWRRARRLGYNQKLDLFENAQTAMRKIYSKSADERTRATGDFEPLDLEVVTVRPRWLCGTFAFHPMLGFRRREQARSIAHGCATTLHRLAEIEPDYLDGWGVDRDALPVRPGEDGGWEEPTRKEAKEASEKGSCWYRHEVPCPFSAQALAGSHLPDVTRDQLALIHRECGKAKTHQPAADS
jgi:predicted acylesterase/phospholipase RssA